MKKLFTTLLGAALLGSASLTFAQGLVISEVLPKPSGTESPYEYVELVATQSINFATTPYTVVVSDGAATANGWKNGGSSSLRSFVAGYDKRSTHAHIAGRASAFT